MKKEQKKFVDTKQHCLYLANPPEADKDGGEGTYQTWATEDFYICALNGESCVAKYLQNETQRGDVFGYAKPKINEEKLGKCSLHNLPIDLAKQVILANINSEAEKKKADLEKRLKSLK